MTKQQYREFHQSILDRLYSHLIPVTDKNGRVHDCYNDLAVDREQWLATVKGEI